MMTQCSTFDQLSDRDLLREVTCLAAGERDATTRLIASLIELDRRRLYLTEGFSSLFGYCTDSLRLSEHAAYDRITAARAAQRFPVILEQLAAGSVTLTSVRLLAPHLTEANHVTLLAEARHRSKRDVEHIIAGLHPQPDVPPSVRKLPAAAPPRQSAGAAPGTGASAEAPQAPATPAAASPPVDQPQARPAPPPVGSTPTPPAAVVTPLAPARYKVSFTVGAETYAKLRQVQDLLRHVVPDGDPAAIYDRALTALLTQLTKAKRGAAERPAASAGAPVRDEAARTPSNACAPSLRSRHIPVAVQRAVWQRDGGQCTFVSQSGRRCAARGFLEFHHTVPFAVGGEASVENLRLLCRAHNAHQAKRDFGLGDTPRVRETPPAYGAPTLELVPARVLAKLWLNPESRRRGIQVLTERCGVWMTSAREPTNVVNQGRATRGIERHRCRLRSLHG
ncbi:MAG: hypothetical protein GEU99_03215 [Luteitalea sp.]|nr:hypothetical protein [Luteitalea sp.]